MTKSLKHSLPKVIISVICWLILPELFLKLFFFLLEKRFLFDIALFSIPIVLILLDLFVTWRAILLSKLCSPVLISSIIIFWVLLYHFILLGVIVVAVWCEIFFLGIRLNLKLLWHDHVIFLSVDFSYRAVFFHGLSFWFLLLLCMWIFYNSP